MAEANRHRLSAGKGAEETAVSRVSAREYEWVPEPLSAIEVAYYRDVLIAHADDLITGVCAICLMSRCPDWQNAFDRLSAAGELMAAPGRWQAVAEMDRKEPL